jgi:hypothetical protein
MASKEGSSRGTAGMVGEDATKGLALMVGEDANHGQIVNGWRIASASSYGDQG